MWNTDFWPVNFWPTNFWADSGETVIEDIILIDGSVNFPITLDSTTILTQVTTGGRFLCPIQDSYGGLIRLKHNFPYLSGYSAVIGYESPSGEFGELAASSFDGTYVKAVIPEGLFNTENKSWKFNARAYGTRNGIPFSIKSNVLTIQVLDGLTNENNY